MKCPFANWVITLIAFCLCGRLLRPRAALLWQEEAQARVPVQMPGERAWLGSVWALLTGVRLGRRGHVSRQPGD